MGEVCIHLENVVVSLLDRPLETGDVGRSKPLLSRALYHEEALGKLRLESLHDPGSSVGGTVLDDEDVEMAFERKHFADDPFDVFLFVVGGDNDYLPVHFFFSCIVSTNIGKKLIFVLATTDLI